jgi:hypothetical protein
VIGRNHRRRPARSSAGLIARDRVWR